MNLQERKLRSILISDLKTRKGLKSCLIQHDTILFYSLTIVGNKCCGSSLHNVRSLVRLREGAIRSPSRNRFFPSCKGIHEDEGKEKSWMLCASIKGPTMCCWELQKDQVVPHRTETFLFGNWRLLHIFLEKFRLWFSAGD